LFEVIHDIVYHGNGGFDWHVVYNMPIWLRRFTYNRISTFLDEKNSANKAQQNASGGTRQIDFAKPPSDFKPGKRM